MVVVRQAQIVPHLVRQQAGIKGNAPNAHPSVMIDGHRTRRTNGAQIAEAKFTVAERSIGGQNLNRVVSETKIPRHEMDFSGHFLGHLPGAYLYFGYKCWRA